MIDLSEEQQKNRLTILLSLHEKGGLFVDMNLNHESNTLSNQYQGIEYG